MNAQPAREIAIANRHPRLRLDRRAVAKVIATLDAYFRPLPGDRPYLTSPSPPPTQSKIENQKSKISPPSPCLPGELSLVFLTDAALAQLHADFLDDPTTTDVITFEGDPALGTAGEICVSADAALRHLSIGPAVRSLNSQLSTFNSAAAAAFSTELTLYLVHGWLHLAGYDDLQPAKKRRMRAAEARCLKLLAAHGVTPHFHLTTPRKSVTQ